LVALQSKSPAITIATFAGAAIFAVIGVASYITGLRQGPDKGAARRVFIKQPPEDLVAYFDQHTALEATRLTEPYVGKWFSVSGPIFNIQPPNLGGDFQVALANQSVYLYFEKTWLDEFSVLKKGDVISVVGRITRIDTLGITAEKCELEEQPSVARPSTPALAARPLTTDASDVERLRLECLQASVAIFEFLGKREQDSPPVTFRSTHWEEDSETYTKYLFETVARYHQEFGAKVESLRNQLDKRGMTTPTIEIYYEHPTNPLGIRALAQSLGALGQPAGPSQPPPVL
jgi:hypothetical protein